MAEIVVMELLFKGIYSLVSARCKDEKEGLEAVKAEIREMSGEVMSLRREMDENMASLSSKLDQLHNTIQHNEYQKIRNEMLEAVRVENRDKVRDGVVNIAIMFYLLTRNTECMQVSLEVHKMMGTSTSQDEENLGTKSVVGVFQKTTAVSEFVSKLLKFDGIGLFSGVSHDTAEPLHIKVTAVCQDGTQKNELIVATGALYLLCKELCKTVQDPRGVMAVEGNAKGHAFAQSGPVLRYNSCLVTLEYIWPSPSEFRKLGKRIKRTSTTTTSTKGQVDLEELHEVLEQQQTKMKVKNIYLLGETGEGKSTLGNALTGSNEFYVSHAGTGTSEIRGSFVQKGGILHPRSDIKVWDTPGMNDEEERDHIYEQMLLRHLTRENSVSTIIIVSKDGSRCPKTLGDTISVYKKAFGDAFSSCVCVFIGLNEDLTIEAKLRAKRQYWVDKLPNILNISRESLESRIFFYNAENKGQERAVERIKERVFSGKPFLTGAAATIVHGLKKMEKAKLVDQERCKMVEASRQEFSAIRDEILNASRVRFKAVRNREGAVVCLAVQLLPTISSRVTSIWSNVIQSNKRDEGEKVFMFTSTSETSKKLLSKTFIFWEGVNALVKMKVIMKIAGEMNLLLINKGSCQMKSRLQRKLQVQKYDLIHIDDQLDTSVFKEVDEILASMESDPSFADIFNSA